MAEHHATVAWRRGEGDFAKGRYSRAHVWRFDGGIEVPASASPSVVRPPWSSEAAVDPEEAFVASLASCHLLTFIDIARHAGFVVDSYEDDAVGVLVRRDDGRYWIAEVTLHPRVAYSGRTPSPHEVADIHEKAHDNCFVANSVTSKVTIAPRDA